LLELVLTVPKDRCSLTPYYNTLQVAVNQVGQRDAAVSVAVSFAALAFGFVLLFVVTTSGSRRRGAVLENTLGEGEPTS